MIFTQKNIKKDSGQTMLMTTVLFIGITMVAVIVVAGPVFSQVRGAREFASSRGSFYASQAVSEDAVYRVKRNKNLVSPLTITLNGATATATTTTVGVGKEVSASGDKTELFRKSKSLLKAGSGASFSYGVQAGEGGFVLENNSSIRGNVFSNGPVTGSGSNKVYGTVISGGPSGIVDGVTATSSVYAHTIKDSTVEKDAHYTVIQNSTVLGNYFPSSPDQATSSLPITDAQITQWEVDATAGGITNSPCPYTISADTTIGPRKINCDLVITGSPVVTLAGALWVAGNITIDNTATVQVSGALVDVSVPFIADNPSDRLTSSKIVLRNSVVFDGAGTDSYILLLSRNNSAKLGGGEKAIEVENSVSGDLLVYAGLGEIVLKNNISLKEVTGYRIRTQNSAEVVYETGLENTLFTGGPGGGYIIDTWREVE